MTTSPADAPLYEPDRQYLAREIAATEGIEVKTWHTYVTKGQRPKAHYDPEDGHAYWWGHELNADRARPRRSGPPRRSATVSTTR